MGRPESPLPRRRSPHQLLALLAALAALLALTGAASAVHAQATASQPKVAGIKPPSNSAPPFGLPFAVGEKAELVTGPHENNPSGDSDACGYPQSGAPCNALDLVPTSGVVRAAGAGTVHIFSYCQPGLVAIDHGADVDGGHWWTGYYHLTNVKVTNGEKVSALQPIGHIGQTKPCGGFATGPHTHFFVKYVPKGQSIGDIFQNTSVDVDLQGFTIGGWKITGRLDAACMTYVATNQKECVGQDITNYGGNGGPANGSFVQESGQPAIYRMIGGAPLYVSSWNNVGGGPQPVTKLSPAEFASLPQYPANGTAIFVDNPGSDHGNGYVFEGGAPLPVKAWTNVGSPKYLGVDEVALFHYASTGIYSHVRQYPANGTAVYVGNPGPPHGSGYVFAGGAPLPVKSWVNVGNPHITPVDQAALDTYATGGAFSHVRQFPAAGTAVAVGNPGPGHGSGYVFAGGAPLSVQNWANVGSPKWVVVDSAALDTYATSGAYSHVRRYPADGTAVYIQNTGSEHGAGFVFAGGAPLTVQNWANVGNPAYSGVDAFALTYHSGTATPGGVRQYPATGTHLRASGTHHFFSVARGVARYLRHNSGSSVLVDDAAIKRAGTGGSWDHLRSGIPKVSMRGARSRSVTGRHATLSWSAPPASSAIAYFQLRSRTIRRGHAGRWSHPAGWRHLTRRSERTHSLARGRTTCFAVRAADEAGNISSWTHQVCIRRT